MSKMMEKHVLPTDAEVRARIDAIGRDFEVCDIKEIPQNHDSEKYRLAFMFQLLVAGRISEVCGRYAPAGMDALKIELDVPKYPDLVQLMTRNFQLEMIRVPAVLFVVKTAKRKGKLRACAMPLDPKYEPWAQPVFDYFKEAGDDHPFMFQERPAHSIRYAQWVAAYAFDGLEWPMKEYSKAIEVEVDKDKIIREAINQRNQDVYLIEQEDGTRVWFTKICDGVVRDHVPVGERWNPFRSHALRKRRNITNMYFYRFDGFQRAAYGGWTEKSQVETMPEAESHYSHLPLEQMKANVVMLESMASLYFYRLLKPYPEGGIPI